MRGSEDNFDFRSVQNRVQVSHPCPTDAWRDCVTEVYEIYMLRFLVSAGVEEERTRELIKNFVVEVRHPGMRATTTVKSLKARRPL